MYNQNVSVPHSFFKKAKKEYSSWKFAFFRELLQNSIDAGAKNINVKIKSVNDSEVLIDFLDDGKGMSKNTLVNAFLALGGSEKDLDTDIGGFGYAKTLILFAHKEFEIQTRDNNVKGSGGQYNIEKTTEYLEGTQVKVLMSYKDSSDDYDVVTENIMKQELENVILYSNLKVSVFLNGDKINKKSTKEDYSYNTPIGRLHFSDDNDSYASYLWIRINGLAMFSHSVYSDNESCFKGYIDLTEKPTEVLTSNRDALKGKSRREFNAIFEKLQKERSSLKTEKVNNFVINKKLVSNNASEEVFSELNESGFSEERPRQLNSLEKEAKNEQPKFSPFKKIIEKNEKEEVKVNKQLEKVAQEDYPLNFNIKNSMLTPAQLKVSLNKESNKKLAKIWRDIVYLIAESIKYSGYSYVSFLDKYNVELETYNENTESILIDSRKLYIGFNYNENITALNSSNTEKIVIYINPEAVKDMRINGDLTISNLIDIALHEMTHIYNENHNENFCSIEMDLRKNFKKYFNLQEWKKIGNVQF
tara:strand:- start:18491 stop:20083 length:1593 start_codon:yes stop_codon:yes gene_type:complete